MEKLKDKSGIAAIAVILILVVVVVAGGATVLAVRMAVTGESYLQPFIDMGLISGDEEENEEVVETASTKGRLIELSSAATAEGVTHYAIDIDSAELVELGIEVYYEAYNAMSYYGSYSSTTIPDEVYDIIDILDSLELVLDVYADGNDIAEVVVYVNYGNTLEDVYDYLYENDWEGVEVEDTYDEFLEDFYDELDDEGLDEDGFIDYCEELFDEMGLDYTASEIEDMVVFEWDKETGEIEMGFEIPDEANEYLADYVNENLDELVEELEDAVDTLGSSVKVSIDEDTYLEDLIDFLVDFVNDYAGSKLLKVTVE